MFWHRWFWGFILRHLARTQGFLDPMVVFARLQRFAQPSEVWVPTELLRSGAVLQARGLINSQAIQHNMDWVWPFWVERQFDPKDVAFIPRAFSMTHINLTHRNWTAIGVPGFADFPIIDPRGLVTPFFDGWSIDGWIVGENFNLIPCRLLDSQQEIIFDNALLVSTTCRLSDLVIDSRAEVKMEHGIPICEIIYTAQSPLPAWLAICPRPYNPEGISFINDIKRLADSPGWKINGKNDVLLSEKPSSYLFSNYKSGDIYNQILRLIKADPLLHHKEIACPIGMASAAALYALEPNQPKTIIVKIPLAKTEVPNVVSWTECLADHCELKIPDQKLKFLYDIALKTLILHSPGEVYPGPFTYKRFWFRDAAFIINALMSAGLTKNVEKIIEHFPSRQTPLGYFLSQDGEWDSNGQAIWTIYRYSQMMNAPIKKSLLSSVERAAKWIQRKRLPVKENNPHSRLLPAGFSAEHLGPTDFYYWDDFWAVAGLKAAAALAAKEDPKMAQIFEAEAQDLLQAIEKSLNIVEARLHQAVIPSAPDRRMDSGAIGSMTASYPLQVLPSQDQRILQTADFLMKKYFLEGGFYHEISHSGINAYLTLHVAQVLLRAGHPQFFDIVKATAEWASPTGQWPEAIHPRSRGGCMGDGQHVWAAAEWVLMLRNMFVREEEATRTLILCSGIPAEWIKEGEKLFLGPTLTIFGKISISIHIQKDIQISWDSQWYGEPPVVEIHWPGSPKQVIYGKQNSIRREMNGVVAVK